MRIAHIITRLIRGGADENTLLSCNGQAEMGHEVHLIYGAEASPAMVSRLHPAVSRHQIRALQRPVTPLNDAWAACLTTSLLRRIKPHIVHTHTSKAGAIGRVAARIDSIPGIVHGIHILPFVNVGRAEQFAYLAAERLLAPVTHAFVDVSHGMMTTALENGIGPAPKHVVVPSGMDLSRFQNAAPIPTPEIASAFGCSEDHASRLKLLVMVAALEPRKRVIEFLDVFARVAEKDASAALAVLGEGVQREEIDARIRELGLGRRVALPGFRNDVERWVARADVCVLASEREGLPRAVVQYVLAGRPTVVTALPGLEAIVEHGRSGFLVETDHLQDMVDPICTLLANPTLAASMAGAARGMDLSRWSTRYMVDRLEDVYRSVLKHDGVLSRA
jgi:glycosyltransferase involved in cell wall biosynthesis